MNLRDYERESIRAFVQRAADDGYLSGRVLDYGCGRQPYADIITGAGSEYRGYDSPDFPANVGGESHTPDWPHVFDAVLCTQVLQYVPRPTNALMHIGGMLRPVQAPDLRERYLVMTYPTNWPEVEPEDLHRFTKAGMERLLTEAGFEIVRHVQRGVLHDPAFPTGPQKRVTAGGEKLAIGYGVIARA